MSGRKYGRISYRSRSYYSSYRSSYRNYYSSYDYKTIKEEEQKEQARKIAELKKIEEQKEQERKNAELQKLKEQKEEFKTKVKELEKECGMFCSKTAISELNNYLEEIDKELFNQNLINSKQKLQKFVQKLSELDEFVHDKKEKYQTIEITANSIMQALYDSDYNVPTYGDIEESGSVKGIRVRADVPSEDGKGNIKIDIDLNGQTTIEIENVPNGEEKLCKNTIKSISSKLKEEGLDLEITDWGRATNVKEDDGMAVEEVDNRGKTRERMERDE